MMTKETKKDLQTGLENTTIQLTQITKTSDLLEALPISDQILTHGRNEVNNEVAKSVIKCAIGLGIELSNYESQILIEDLIDKYKYDSIEDLQVCLKKGRQGFYGKVYGKLNMIVISEWMSSHLEEKAIAREKRHHERSGEMHKHNWISREEYAKSVTRDLGSKEVRNVGFIDDQYQKFKAAYEAKKIKDQNTKR